MKTAASALLVTLLSSAPVFAVDTIFLEPIEPVSPVLKGMGGVSTPNAEGFDALFINPAAYSVPKTDLTFFLLETTSHISMSGLNRVLDARESWSNPTGPTMSGVINSLLAGAGVGQEVSTGAGWVGNQLGLGMLVQSRLLAQGRNLIVADATIETSLTGVVGMGWPFDVGLGTLRVGGAIRPSQRLYSTANAYDMLMNANDLGGYFSSIPISSGFSLGIDVGLRWDYASFQTALVVRDANAPLVDIKEYSVAQLTSSYGLSADGVSPANTVYRIPTVIALGTAWTPDMGSLSSLFQPSLAMDLQIPMKDKVRQSSFWTWTHIGASAKLLKSVSIRTGLNQGYLTFGLGARLLIVDFNLAIFAQELGRISGAQRRPGISMEWAFRL